MKHLSQKLLKMHSFFFIVFIIINDFETEILHFVNRSLLLFSKISVLLQIKKYIDITGKSIERSLP